MKSALFLAVAILNLFMAWKLGSKPSEQLPHLWLGNLIIGLITSSMALYYALVYLRAIRCP